jgi:hypothetical protein
VQNNKWNETHFAPTQQSSADSLFISHNFYIIFIILHNRFDGGSLNDKIKKRKKERKKERDLDFVVD